MTTTLVTLTGDVTDAIGTDFDARRTKAYVRHNTAKIVTDGDEPIHLGGGTVNVGSDGTFTLPNVVAATSLVENLQATVYIDYADPATRQRATATFGPYDLSAETGTVDIRTLEAVQALDPSFASDFMAQAQELLAAQITISGIDDTDSAVAALIEDALIGPLTRAALSALMEGTSVPLSNPTRHAPALGLWFPEAEGAVGDGTNDDTTAINAAISAAETAGGGTVVLAANTVYSVTTINSANKVTVQGASWGSVLKLRSTISTGVLSIGAHDGFIARDLKIDGDRTNVAGDSFGIYKPDTAAASNLRIENVWVASAGYIGIGILGLSDRSVLTENVVIEGCLTTDTGGHGIITQNAIDNVVVDKCTIETFGRVHSDTPGITVGRNSYDAKVTSCTVDGAGAAGTSAHGISIDTTLDASTCIGNTVRNTVGLGIEIGYCHGSTVVGNTVTDGDRAGIMVTASADDAVTSFLGTNAGTPANMAIIGNVIRRCVAGIDTFVASPQSDSATAAWKLWYQSTAYSLADRIVYKQRLYEVTTAGTTGATVPATFGTTVRTDTVTDNTLTWTDRGPIINGVAITGNICEDNAQNGIGLSYIYNFTLTGNICSGNGRAGIYINSNSNIGTISGNTLSGNCVTDISGAYADLRVLTLAATKQHRIKIGHNMITSRAGSFAVIATEGANNITGRFTNADTTPSVAFGDVFYTQNSGATSITKFDDELTDFLGRIIAVRFVDANTTLVHNPSYIDLAGDVNYNPPAGTLMTFGYIGLAWRELSRTAP